MGGAFFFGLVRIEKMKSVTHYRAEWFVDRNSGKIALIFGDGGEESLEGLEAAAFHALVDVLRNERPIQWNPVSRSVTTLSEMTGEGEIR